MSLEELFTNLKRVLQDGGCQVTNLGMDTRIEELGIDSIELSIALLNIEDHFQILVSDETWAGWQVTGDILNYIAEYKQSHEILKSAAPEKQEGTE